MLLRLTCLMDALNLPVAKPLDYQIGLVRHEFLFYPKAILYNTL